MGSSKAVTSTNKWSCCNFLFGQWFSANTRLQLHRRRDWADSAPEKQALPLPTRCRAVHSTGSTAFTTIRLESTPLRPRRYYRATFGNPRCVNNAHPPLHQRRLPLRWRTKPQTIPRDTAQRVLPYAGTKVCAVDLSMRPQSQKAQCSEHYQKRQIIVVWQPLRTTRDSLLKAYFSHSALIGRVVVRRELRSVPVRLVGSEGFLHLRVDHSPNTSKAIDHLLPLPLPLHRHRHLWQRQRSRTYHDDVHGGTTTAGHQLLTSILRHDWYSC